MFFRRSDDNKYLKKLDALFLYAALLFKLNLQSSPQYQFCFRRSLFKQQLQAAFRFPMVRNVPPVWMQ